MSRARAPDPSGPPHTRPASNRSGAEAQSLPAGLYVAAVPIGNLADITLRALDLLARADLVVCEDTRVTGKLMAAHGLKNRMTPYHEHNAAKARPLLLERIRAGEALVLVSDAGTPALADPGFRLIRAAIEAGLPVTAAPGPNAAVLALVASGLPTDRFFFQGFLPPRGPARRAALMELAPIRASLVFYEGVSRLADTLADMATALGDRPAAVARELTKMHEEFRRASLSELAAHYAEAGPPKGEVVIVVAPPKPTAADPDDPAIIARLRALLAADLGVRQAAARLAEETGLKRADLYRRALALRGDRDDPES